MPAKATANELSKLISHLRQERQSHVNAIADIDETFSRFGIEADGTAGPARRGRPKKSKTKAATKKAATSKAGTKKPGRRKRRSFKKTAEESVVGFIKQHGKPNAAEINSHWRTEGRGGKADNTLTKLVKEGKLKRVQVKDERGGRYQAA
ncbi:MAG: hypothetical protein WD118_08905 [Phycisphaeraceae bacterium]